MHLHATVLWAWQVSDQYVLGKGNREECALQLEQLGKPMVDVQLRPGQVLYVPRGGSMLCSLLRYRRVFMFCRSALCCCCLPTADLVGALGCIHSTSPAGPDCSVHLTVGIEVAWPFSMVVSEWRSQAFAGWTTEAFVGGSSSAWCKLQIHKQPHWLFVVSTAAVLCSVGTCIAGGRSVL